MKRIARILGVAALVALPALASAGQSYSNVALVDVNCAQKVKADPDAHTRACALKCAASGFGVWTGDTYLKFDAAGNEKAVAALKASSKKDHLRVDVSGALEGETLRVESLKLLE
jgi:hypothetical protein